MKTKALLLGLMLLGWVLSKSLHAQTCYVYAWSDSTNFACTNDSVTLFVYNQQGTYFTIHWGDGLYTISNYFGGTYGHYYANSGIYFPYIVTECGDTVIPNINNSFGQQTLYFNISDSCLSIQGRAYVDVNNNCYYDVGIDQPLAYKPIHIYQNSQLISWVFTNYDGLYFANVASGMNTISISQIPNTFQLTCGTINPASFNGNASYDFVFGCNSQVDLSADIHSVFFTHTVPSTSCFEVSNISCNTQVANFVVSLPPDLIYMNTYNWFSLNTLFSPAPTVTGNTQLLFNNVTIQPFSSVKGCIKHYANPSMTQLGDTLCLSIQITTTDIDATNNYAIDCGMVVTSYDPNIKVVHVDNRPGEGYINNNEVMEYTIHFQNTGNFPAKDIRIEDILDENVLDINTLRFVSSSHVCEFLINNNQLTVLFPDIWLPDSTSDEPNSHGFVKFTVHQKPNLSPGTQIENTADIYFDYNPPITTNTVVSIIQSPSAGINEMDINTTISVYPNPSHEVIFVSNEKQEVMQIKLFNSIGQQILQTKGNHTVKIDASSLSTGYYLLSVESDDKLSTYKVLIQK